MKPETKETLQTIALGTCMFWFPALILGIGALVIYSGLDVYLGLR